MSTTSSSGAAGTIPTKSAAAQPPCVTAAIACGLVICVAGGFMTGFLLTKHAVLGVALLGVGALAGFISRKITGTASRTTGRALVAGCVVAFCLAMVSWYRWGITLPDENGGRRDPTWTEAITRAPKLLLQFQAPVTLVVSALCAAFGAAEALRQTGPRYRLVEIRDD
jgi:hypothetical protein